MKPFCLALLLALPALAHAPPLERLPAVVAAQAEAPAPTAELNKAVVEETQTESMVLKLIGILIVPIGGLLSAILAIATAWLNGKRKDNKAAGGIAQLLELLAAHLATAKAELAPLLQEALADGKLTGAEREVLKKKMIELVLRSAPEGLLKMVRAFWGTAFDGWLEGKAHQVIDAAAAESGAETSP